VTSVVADERPTPPREEVRQWLVGAATILLFAAVLFLSYRGYGGGGVDGYRLFALFNHIDGLAVGDDVHVSGIPVGEVEEATLGPDFRARVTLRIASGVTLPRDTSAAIHTDGLFGRKFVVLEPGGDEEMLADGGTITFTQDSLIVSELMELIIAEGRSKQRSAAPAAPTPGTAAGAGN